MIQILLATYNGSEYLEDQMNSLFLQTNQDWTLLIHDDGSTDSTIDIINQYCNRYPERIFLMQDGIVFGNSKDNFIHLLAASSAEYLMFCDQDDVWLPDKVEKTFSVMKSLAPENRKVPIVIHTDLEVVDRSLSSISPSMFDYQGLSKSIEGLLQILVRNSVTGCTMMINRKAVEVSLPISSSAVMHDWWIAANVIKYNGSIVFIDEALLKYRQHNSNSVGAKKNTLYRFVLRCIFYTLHRKERAKIYNQAKVIAPELNKFIFFKGKIKLSIKSFLNGISIF